MAGVPVDFSRLCVLMREGRADHIEELYKERINVLKTFHQKISLLTFKKMLYLKFLMPEEFQQNFSARKTKGDGNCLYNAAAIGIGGIFKVKIECMQSLFCFRLYVPVNKFSVILGWLPGPGLTSTKPHRGWGWGPLLVNCVPICEQRTAKLTLNSVFDILKLIPLFTVSSQKVTLSNHVVN